MPVLRPHAGEAGTRAPDQLGLERPAGLVGDGDPESLPRDASFEERRHRRAGPVAQRDLAAAEVPDAERSAETLDRLPVALPVREAADALELLGDRVGVAALVEAGRAHPPV